MTKKFNEDAKLTPEDLAKQLRHPDGEIGKQVGLEMNKGNRNISLKSYELLQAKSGDQILEIGMGNGYFVKDLLRITNDLRYTGIDYSPVMVEESKQINKEFVDSGEVNFLQASIEDIPFEADCFDLITTTNTLYFWPNAKENIKELVRVLKPNGKLLIGYRSKSCLDQISFTQFGFNKYDPLEVEKLLSQSGLMEVATEIIEEPEIEFDGKPYKMEGLFTSGIKT